MVRGATAAAAAGRRHAPTAAWAGPTGSAGFSWQGRQGKRHRHRCGSQRGAPRPAASCREQAGPCRSGRKRGCERAGRRARAGAAQRRARACVRARARGAHAPGGAGRRGQGKVAGLDSAGVLSAHKTHTGAKRVEGRAPGAARRALRGGARAAGRGRGGWVGPGPRGGEGPSGRPPRPARNGWAASTSACRAGAMRALSGLRNDGRSALARGEIVGPGAWLKGEQRERTRRLKGHKGTRRGVRTARAAARGGGVGRKGGREGGETGGGGRAPRPPGRVLAT
jgi:hypothetical protein